MPCKIQITKEITSLVEKQTEPFMGLSLKLANKKVEKVNKFFRAKVAEFVMIGDIMDRIITIPESLVQIYYNNELKIEEREAARLLKEEEEKERKYVESKKEEWEQNREYFENDEPFTRSSSITKSNNILSNISSLGKLQGDLMESEKGQIGVNKQQLLILLGPTMYNKPLAQVAVKELLQNSFDAIKTIQNTQKIVKKVKLPLVKLSLDKENIDKLVELNNKMIAFQKAYDAIEDKTAESAIESAEDLYYSSTDIKDYLKSIGVEGYEVMDKLDSSKLKKIDENGITDDVIDETNVKTGNIDITVNIDNRTISIKDDGIGMTPDIVKNAFLSIGGTNKEGLDVSERSGGFGLAKVQFLLGSEYVKVVTIRDGIKTSLEATAIQLYNDDFTINKENTTESSGSYVEIKVPESYTTPEGTKREIDFPGKFSSNVSERFDILNKPLIGDINVNFKTIKNKQETTKVLPIGKNNSEELLPPLFSKIEFAWGTADLYMSIDKKGRPQHRILSSGIYQFNHYFSFKDYENIPYDIVVNIKPSVSSTSEQYPFNNQREGFKNTVIQDIKSLNNYLKKYASGEAEKDAKAVFSNITGLPKVDPNKVLTPEEREKLYADIDKTIEENKQRRINNNEESAEEAVKKIYKLIINQEGVKNKDTGNLEIFTEKNYNSSFKANKEIEKVDAIETINFNPALPQYHNNTNINYLKIEGAAEFFSDFGSVVLEMVRFAGNELGYDYNKLKSEDEKFFAGISIDKQYGGVHVRKIINAIFVNPLAFDVESLEEAVGVALHVLIHEINHTTVSGEGANFTTALGILYGKIYGTGKYALYEGLFRSVYRKHFETFKKLKYEYEKSSTRNLSESFEGDSIETDSSRAVQGNVNDVSAGQPSAKGYNGNQENNTGDKVGDVILSKLNDISQNIKPGVENTDSLKELLDNEKLDFQDAILIDLINKVAPNQESLPTTEEVVEELPSQQSIDSQKQNNSYSDLVLTIKGLMNTLGIKIVKAEVIYLKQQEINTLYNKLASSKSDTEKQSIQKQIDELKREGVRKNVLGLADTLNGVINLALSENNIDESEFALNEEMLHFIVDIIEQKYPDLYKELLQKVGTYNLYNQMYKVYSLQEKYQNEDGSVKVNKIKKEAVAKVLNDFLTNSEYSEEDYQLSKTQLLWNKIKDTLKSFFEEKNNNIAANNFRFTLDKLLNDPSFITKEDAKLLSGDEFFGIMGTISSVMMGKEAAFSTKNFLSPLDFVKHVLEIKANSSKVYVDKNTNKITSPTEPNSVERYTIKTLTGVVIIGSRVSDFVTKFLDKIFPNNTSKNNKELELAAERGVIIHNIFELTFAKYVDPATGIVRKQPINSSPQLEIYEKRYAKEEGLSMPVKIDKYVQELIALYPNSYFLTEVPIFNKSLTVGGTIDLMIVDANKKIHIYDWKTKKADVHKGQGIIQKRDKIDPWNIKAWRIQLDAYMDILKYNYNVESFGKVRMIPIMTEFESNGTTISNINIGSEKTPDIRQRQLLAVPSKQELTGLSETDKLIKANYKLAEKLQIQANKVSDMGEKEKLRLESSVLEDLAIDLQVGKGIQSLVNKLEQILKIHDDIIEKDRNGEIKSSDLPIIASAIVDLSIYNTDSRLINVAEELFSKFDSLSDLQKETKKELQDLSVNVSNKITELKKVLINSAELFGNDQGIYDINKVENEIENTAGLLSFAGIFARRNSIYQLNFKTGQLFANLVRGVQNQIERERITVRNTLEKIKVDYLKDFGGILKSDESVFSILFRYPTEEEIKNGAIDGPKLVAKIDKKFYSTLKEQKENFVNLINASIKTKKDFTKSASYTELLKWLEDNIHLEEWKKHYATRKENQKNLLETQYSYIKDEEERDYTIQQALTSWEYRNNILKSPGAFNSNNISAFINEEKWLSSDYKKIKSSPSALAAYNAFREIMFNARRVGYIQDLSQISEIPTNITTKNKLAYYYSLVKLHGSLKYLYFNSIPEVLKNMLIKPLENNLALEDIKNGFSNINPITQEEELELPVYMLRDFNVQIDKEGRLKSLKDLDLFKVYEELAFHVINFQNLSATEELADAIIMVEESKNFEKQMNAQGNTNENKKIVKQTKTKEDILKHTKNFIWYNKSKEKEKTTVFNFSVNKIVDTMKSYAAALYLGFNHALAFKALTASTLSSFSNAGDVYSKRDVLFAPLKRVINSSLIEKSFSYHVSSSTLHENRLKNNNYAKKLAIFGREYLLNSLSVVDYEIQKNLFYASLPNFTIIEEAGVKKIVNINKYVDNKYPDIYKETPEKRKEIFEKKNKEKEELKKNNLGVQLQERAKKFSGNDMSLDLSDIDTKSIDQFTNIVQETSKRVLGNMSDKDIYLWKTGNLMTLLTQFKSFAFKIFDVRWGDIKYNSPLERHTYGKFRALSTFMLTNQQTINENNEEILRTKVTASTILSGITRFVHVTAPFLNVKQQEDIIQILKVKYLQYAITSKNKNEGTMSEKEYIEMYLTELTSAKNELYILLLFAGLLTFAAGGDDDEDSWWLKYIKNIIRGTTKELLFPLSPNQMSSMGALSFPALGALATLFNAFSFQFGNVVEFNIDSPLYIKVDPFQYTLGERLSPIIKATPYVRPTSALLAEYSQDWRHFLNVDKKSRSLVKNRLK